MAEETLDSIIANEEPTAEATEAEAPEVETPEPEAPEAEDTATAAVEGETTKEPEKEPETAPEKDPWTKTAYLSEKKKRQALEKQLQEVEKKPLPDVIDDQSGFVESLREEFRLEVHGMKTELSQDMMRELHDDYDEMEARFLELAADNPALRQQLQEAHNPAKFAYDTASKYRELEKLENIDAYKEQIKQEVEAKLREEILGEKADKDAKTAEKDAALKPSLVEAGETTSDSEVEESLEQIMGLDARNRK